MDRNITLTSKFLYQKLKCYKGKVIGKLEIGNQHLGHKFGEFFVTKVLGERVAYRKRLKLLQKKQKGRLKNSKKK
jgi:ribosomal protein S19